MQQRNRNTLFNGLQDTAIIPVPRQPGTYRKIVVKHVTSLMPAYHDAQGDWKFAGWYGQCRCGYQTRTYLHRGFPGLLLNRHLHDSE